MNDNIFVSRSSSACGFAVTADLYVNLIQKLRLKRKGIGSFYLEPGHYEAFFILGSMNSNTIEFDVDESTSRIELELDPGLAKHVISKK
ncbi:MAG: hypothetical protein MJ194_03145 [Clostridia bacterium]|nr:hypothetical protein [Clostridia bacterium]